MTFRKLAETFQELEKTSSRNEMTVILAGLLAETDADQVSELINLSLGQLGSAYEQIQFNLAEKQVQKAMARAYGKSDEEVKTLYKKVGDLGSLAQELRKDLHHKADDPKVAEIYSLLIKIAKDDGQGSQDRKIEALAELLKKVDGLSARYIVRVVMGKLRLGFSDKTILDAVSWMEKKDKSLKKELELAYQIRPDIGWLTERVKKIGAKKATENVEATLGIPIMPMLCQRLKSPKEMVKKMGEVAVEPKFDGTRCISGYTGLFVEGRGYISVREIRVGDKVLTHKGRFRKVTAKTVRARRRGESVFRFQTYLGDELKISEGHKVLIGSEGKLIWRKVEDVKAEWVYFPRPVIDGDPVCREYEYIDKAGYKKNIIWDKDFFRFLGFWVGDGISNNNHQMERVGIVINNKHTKLIQQYEKIIRNTLKIVEISKDKRNGIVVIYWRDPVFRKWLCDNFRGKNESGKRIPEWFYGLDENRFFAFLQGWKEADGTSRSKVGNRIVTKERQLALMAQVLGFKHGVPIGVRRERLRARPGGVKKTYYSLILSGTSRYVKKIREGYLVKIRKKLLYRQASHRLRLYDVEVETDNSFCISTGTLHNCQIHFNRKEGDWKVKTFTRNLEETSHMFPELTKMAEHVNAKELVLDSEAVGIDPKTGKMMSFQMTITRKRKHGIEAQAGMVPLKFFVFDVMYKDGKSLIDKSYEERRKILKESIKDRDLLVIDDYWLTDDAEAITKKHHDLIKQGYEGVVVKDIESKYVPGRTGWRWVKMKEEEESHAKLSDTLDCVVMGYYAGRGKRSAFGLGAFLVGVLKGEEVVTIAKIGTGLTDEQFKEMKIRLDRLVRIEKPKMYIVDKNLTPDGWVEPKLVVEIAADEITKSPIHSAGVALRFPRLIKFRDDKNLSGVTSLEEVKEIM